MCTVRVCAREADTQCVGQRSENTVGRANADGESDDRMKAGYRQVTRTCSNETLNGLDGNAPGAYPSFPKKASLWNGLISDVLSDARIMKAARTIGPNATAAAIKLGWLAHELDDAMRYQGLLWVLASRQRSATPSHVRGSQTQTHRCPFRQSRKSGRNRAREA